VESLPQPSAFAVMAIITNLNFVYLYTLNLAIPLFLPACLPACRGGRAAPSSSPGPYSTSERARTSGSRPATSYTARCLISS
uniref:Uncharacterized protein n=1 Tax=Aegilops tauschii subsp. strangulata TaxID=200361 RepID=A0A453Q8L1_AEGTS